ncbi:restriction endonuclease subunit S [Lactobacillus sp. UMNPBX1]|nr:MULTISPECIES: restriction endonuclease subunit S [Lactobacillus]OXC32546.1 restriction endonuclease subunit S [Lactobacillus crispatus]OXC40409.1 restriction endonuclease subunit S [Lactobacillus crispatus]PEH12432.1 restriction endonuclease subunit S [Lactobacillus sp. UMNPBX1]
MKTNTLDFDAQALREKILDLAMRGKLVPQDPNDEPASVLLEKIKAEKEQLIKEKKIKKSKPLAPITDDEKPFDIPDSWEWVRFGDVGLLKNGKTPKKEDISSDNIYPYFKVKDMNNNNLYMENAKNWVGEKYSRQVMPKNTIIFPKNGGAILTAKKRILTQDSLVDLNTGGLIPYNDLNHKFIFYLFLSLDIKDFVKGSAVPTINSKKLKETLVPLPPLEEQSRIAAKIAQLFALLRKVESSTQQYAKLQTLMKSKVLDLAMRGKLVEQDPHDEPASVLLEKIKAEKRKMIKEKKIKKSKPLPPITDDEKPFDIPDSWEWVRLGDIGAITSGGTPKTSEKSYWINGTIPWITPAVMAKCKDQMIFNSESVKRINNLGLEKSSAHLIPKNSLVVSSRAPIGYVNIVPFEYTTNQGCKSVSLYKDISEEFIYFALKNSVSDMNNRASGTTFKEISGTKFSQTIIPLPPLKEQTKISQKIRVLATIIHNF